MRQHELIHTMNQSEGRIQGHITSTWAFLKGMREHHNGGDINQIRCKSTFRRVGS